MKDTLVSIAMVLLVCLCPAIVGYQMASNHYEKVIAEMEQAQAVAVSKARSENAEALSKATDTINVAQDEYRELSLELSRTRARLRHALNTSGSGKDNSADALRARVAKLEELVQRLVDSGSECGRLYQRSAQQHDALAEAVK